MKTKTPFTEAADGLATVAMARQFNTTVTDEEARDEVDAKVIADWLVAEGTTRDLEVILADTIRQRMNEVQARGVLVGLALNHAEGVCKPLREALVEQVAHDLAYAANKLVASWEPDEADMARSYASQVDDPVARDRAVIARKYSHV